MINENTPRTFEDYKAIAELCGSIAADLKELNASASEWLPSVGPIQEAMLQVRRARNRLAQAGYKCFPEHKRDIEQILMDGGPIPGISVAQPEI